MILFVPYKKFLAAKLSFNDVINKIKQLTMLLIQSSTRFFFEITKGKTAESKTVEIEFVSF